uniref:Putative phosphatase and actin regulator 4-a n=1 Tax=Amblyomma triste TaxID=251400 RepID=A0A023G1E0_AMBTT
MGAPKITCAMLLLSVIWVSLPAANCQHPKRIRPPLSQPPNITASLPTQPGNVNPVHPRPPANVRPISPTTPLSRNPVQPHQPLNVNSIHPKQPLNINAISPEQPPMVNPVDPPTQCPTWCPKGKHPGDWCAPGCKCGYVPNLSYGLLYCHPAISQKEPSVALQQKGWIKKFSK